MKAQRPRSAPQNRRGGPPRDAGRRGGPTGPVGHDLPEEQGPAFGNEDMQRAMARQQRGEGQQPERDGRAAVVSQPEGLDLAAAQQMNLEPGDVDVDKNGDLQLHFDGSEDLLVSTQRGIQELRMAAGPGAATGPAGGSRDGSNIRVLLYAPHLGAAAQGGASGGTMQKASGAMQRKVTAFSQRLEESLTLLARSGVAPGTLRIFLGTEWFRDDQGRPWSPEEQQLAVQMLSGDTATFMNILVVPGTLRWAASAMLPDLNPDEPRP